MPATKFDKDVCAIQNVALPAAERAAGHPLLATERMTITQLIRETLSNPGDRNPVAELAKWVTPKAPVSTSLTEATKVRPHFAETAKVPTAPVVEDDLAKARRLVAEADAAAAGKPLTKEQAAEQAAVLQKCRLTAEQMLRRGLTTAEGRDLEQTVRERFAKAANVTEAGGHHSFGEAELLAHRGKSPFFTPAQESAAGTTAQPPASASAEWVRLPIHSVERREAYEAAMSAFARTQPFGGQRLDNQT